ncbi:unnamed protein product [Rhizophagus irregularis]|nr:unnamed protein product [Rhizophagus irregularis]
MRAELDQEIRWLYNNRHTVDLHVKSLEDLLCITEGKPRNIKIGYAQNLAQLESAFQTNKKKRTADQAFGNDYFDYIYG